ncbi:MAG: hypothetical protein HYZ45_10270 [Burkholderiales bacterium]|nr:hypothetical protein [Burkholderiales bacterium]
MNKLEVTGPSVPFVRVVMVVLWPAFLMACVSCGVIFSLVDPEEMVLLDHHIHLSSIGFYTLGFLVFWLLGSVASSITVLLMLTGRTAAT